MNKMKNEKDERNNHAFSEKEQTNGTGRTTIELEGPIRRRRERSGLDKFFDEARASLADEQFRQFVNIILEIIGAKMTDQEANREKMLQAARIMVTGKTVASSPKTPETTIEMSIDERLANHIVDICETFIDYYFQQS